MSRQNNNLFPFRKLPKIEWPVTRTPNQPQNEPLFGYGQVQNTAGGYVWTVDDWMRLDRFLVLGSEGGTYYTSPRALALENAEAVLRCLQADGLRTVARITEVSTEGRAPKNSPALFALAMAAGLGDDPTRQAALAALPQVARTGTHLFNFLGYVEQFRGWGRALRRAVGNWYTEMPAHRLAYQTVKYRQRDGWTHRDALRLSHPKASSEQHQAIFHWVTQGWPGVGEVPHPDAVLRKIWAYERAKTAAHEREIVRLVSEHNLPWEAVPTKWLKSPSVWEALLPTLPMTALLRNLGRLSAIGLLGPLQNANNLVADRLTNEDHLQKARIHPIAVLAALTTYEQGKGMRGKLLWTPVPRVVDALNAAFYLSFGNVQPSGKRVVLALDVSGSMGYGLIAGIPGLSPRAGSAAMALVTAATEQDYTVIGFSHELIPLNISPGQRLNDAIRTVSNIPFGATDCALPMQWALKNKVEADAFVVYTDSETWFGKVHPAQALGQYRAETGIQAKLAVVGMVANSFSIADPNDAGMLDVVGFDTATPQILADFVRG